MIDVSHISPRAKRAPRSGSERRRAEGISVARTSKLVEQWEQLGEWRQDVRWTRGSTEYSWDRPNLLPCCSSAGVQDWRESLDEVIQPTYGVAWTGQAATYTFDFGGQRQLVIAYVAKGTPTHTPSRRGGGVSDCSNRLPKPQPYFQTATLILIDDRRSWSRACATPMAPTFCAHELLSSRCPLLMIDRASQSGYRNASLTFVYSAPLSVHTRFILPSGPHRNPLSLTISKSHKFLHRSVPGRPLRSVP